MDIFKSLKTLTETPGPSGSEQAISTMVQELWQPHVDSVTVDRIGNVIAVKEGQAPSPRSSLLLAAHMDEIALMVTQVIEKSGHGFLRVTNIGGVDSRHLYGQLVTVHAQRDLPGVIGALPRSMLPQDRRYQAPVLKDLLVDVGLPIETVKTLVSIGDFISFRQPLRQLSGQFITGKALDNRASLTAVTACLHHLTHRAHTWDVIVVATIQEETGLIGAFTSGYAQQPDAAIALDVTFGKGIGTSGPNVFELGTGPVLDLGPNVHPGMYKALQKAASTIEMSVSTGVHRRSSGTDAFGLQIARTGVPTGLLSVPVRYMHTMVEVVHATDIKRTGRLLAEFITQLDDQFLENLTATLLGEDDD